MDFINFEIEFLKAFNNLFDSRIGIYELKGIPFFYYMRKVNFLKELNDLSIIPFQKSFPELNREILQKLFIEFKDVDTITFYKINEISGDINCCVLEKYFTYLCSVDSYKYHSNILRNIKKYLEELNISVTTEYEDYLSILMLGNKKVISFDDKEIMSRQARFLCQYHKNIISFNIKHREAIIAGIICIIKNNHIEMICCNYNSSYIKYNLNDKLYYTIIEWCRNNNLKLINWGNVSTLDDGLMRFKKKFSNLIKENQLCHCFRDHKILG